MVALDECGLCSGGITDLDPNSSEDICGTCNGEATIENTTLLFYDYNGDDIEDTPNTVTLESNAINCFEAFKNAAKLA